MTERNHQQTTVDDAVDRVLEAVQHNVAESLDSYVEGIQAIGKAAVLAQRMATQRVALGVIIRQRLALAEQAKQAEGHPILEQALACQADVMDAQLIEALSDIGVPKKLAETSIGEAVKLLPAPERYQATRAKNGTFEKLERV